MAAPIKFRRLLCSRSLNTFCRFLHSKRRTGDVQQQNETHFGFQNVAEDEKEEKVYEVFKNVASKYDLMNDAMSGGVHRLWKDQFIHRLAPTPGTKLLDVAGGTGDIAFRFLKYLDNAAERANDTPTFKNLNVDGFNLNEDDTSSSSSSDEEGHVKHHVTVCDINQEMLNVGKQRAENYGINTGISWLKGNAESLPLEDNQYDAYTIAFGIRNCTHIDKVVEEAYRVLKPGGRFMCLEFSEVKNPLLRSLYDNYSFQVIPVMGQVLARDWKSYQYLVESIRQFPNQEDFRDLIRSVGFSMVTYENLTFGVAAIHSGFKL